MIELDFLFLYEHKVRELENLCLAKYELDKRGYKTKIMFVEDARNTLAVKPVYHAKVLCTMACYNDGTLQWHAKDFVRFEKVIDLQWENIVYPKDEQREGAYKNYTGIGKEVVRVSWGKQNVKRLLEAAHMDPQKVKMVGHMGMDFLREPLNNYYLSCRELFDKYGIPEGKKVILFASPYYGDSLSQAYIDDMCMRFGSNWTDYYKFMCDSQHIVLNWFEKMCQDHPDIVMVYRPHPGHPSKMAKQLEEKYDNFRIIAEESVKQWIVACDKIYTGNSSVVVEAFFAKKMCQLLFPLPVTEGFELKMISDSAHITTYERFMESVLAAEETFPTPQDSIEEVYLIDWEIPNYIKFADMAEEVLGNDYYRLSHKQLRDYKHYSIGTRLLKRISSIDPLYRMYLKLLENGKIQWNFIVRQRQLREIPHQVEIENANELTSEEEIEQIIKKISNAISKGETK